MLTELYIKNLAIIDEVRISFGEGLNILTGETGTGKSIIINSIALICGGRANTSLIGKRGDMAFVEGAFFLDEFEKSFLNEKFKSLELDIKIDEDLFIVSRSISRNGRSVSRINNRIVNNSVLSEIMFNIINICGQHDSYTLFNKTNFVELLDSFCGDDFNKNLLDLRDLYLNIKNTNNSVKKLSSKMQNAEDKIENLREEIEVFHYLDLENLDERELENQLENMDSRREVFNNCVIVDEIFSSEYKEENLLNLLNMISGHFSNIENFDSNFKLTDEFEDINTKIRELYFKFKNYHDQLDIDEEKMIELQNKYDILNNLKYKYKKSKEELISYRDSLEDELYFLDNSEEVLKNEILKLKRYKEDYLKLANSISKTRIKIANEFEKNIERELLDLDLKNSKFKIEINSTNKISPMGFDEVSFLISTNKGEELNEISKIASGGEMSRIMLGFKKVLSDRDKISTLIFDEIDTGISGITAQIVGEKLIDISKNHQLIVISHLPQISVLSDRHFIITKNTDGNETVSNVKMADKKEKIMEISRLIGGSNINDITIRQSEEMIKLADELKGKIR